MHSQRHNPEDRRECPARGFAGLVMSNFSTYHREATVVLTDSAGRVLGKLPPVHLATPWLQEIGDLVDQCRQWFDLDITVLRLLSVDHAQVPKLRVDYLAEVEEVPTIALEPWTGTLADHALRLPYARVGGPALDLQWANAQITNNGYPEIQSARQVRTWNLSSIWELQTSSHTFWLKCVPPFLAHESTLLAALDEEPVPRLLAAEGGRTLLWHLPGEDCYGASPRQLEQMVTLLVDLQWRWRDRAETLAARGVPALDSAQLLANLHGTAEIAASSLEPGDSDELKRVLEAMPRWLAELEDSGLPTTLVHGDCHPGNWRGTGLALALLDWGDAFLGNPLLDVPAMLASAGAHRDALRAGWIREWQERVPDASIGRAMELAEPIALARLATVYQRFLDHIEPSERVYHEGDPADCLRRLVREFQHLV